MYARLARILNECKPQPAATKGDPVRFLWMGKDISDDAYSFLGFLGDGGVSARRYVKSMLRIHETSSQNAVIDDLVNLGGEEALAFLVKRIDGYQEACIKAWLSR